MNVFEDQTGRARYPSTWTGKKGVPLSEFVPRPIDLVLILTGEYSSGISTFVSHIIARPTSIHVGKAAVGRHVPNYRAKVSIHVTNWSRDPSRLLYLIEVPCANNIDTYVCNAKLHEHIHRNGIPFHGIMYFSRVRSDAHPILSPSDLETFECLKQIYGPERYRDICIVWTQWSAEPAITDKMRDERCLFFRKELRHDTLPCYLHLYQPDLEGNCDSSRSVNFVENFVCETLGLNSKKAFEHSRSGNTSFLVTALQEDLLEEGTALHETEIGRNLHNQIKGQIEETKAHCAEARKAWLRSSPGWYKEQRWFYVLDKQQKWLNLLENPLRRLVDDEDIDSEEDDSRWDERWDVEDEQME